MNNDLFRFIRVQKRFTQRDFARKIGVSRALVALIELHERQVTESTATKVISSLGITDAELNTIAILQSLLKGDELAHE